MRILQICNRVPWPPNNGGAIGILNMTRGLHRLGHELHLLCLNAQEYHLESQDMSPLFHELASFKSISIDTDITAWRAAVNLLFSRKSYNIERFYSREFENEIVAILRGHSFDIIQLEGLHLCPYIKTIRKYSKTRIVLRAHNVEYIIWERLAASETNPFRRAYLSILAKRLKRYEMLAIKEVDCIVPVSDSDANVFHELGTGADVFVSHIGLDMANYVNGPSKQDWPGLFHLGGLKWRPNLQGIAWFLKDIWPLVRAKNPDLKFYLAGPDIPDEMKWMEDQGVICVGEVVDAISFMNSKSIMVVPLLAGSGTRIKIMEAMALGKAIVSTSIGAEGIDYEDKINIMIADAPQSFAEAIQACIHDQALVSFLGSNARKLAEHEYNNASLIVRLALYYEHLCQSTEPVP